MLASRNAYGRRRDTSIIYPALKLLLKIQLFWYFFVINYGTMTYGYVEDVRNIIDDMTLTVISPHRFSPANYTKIRSIDRSTSISPISNSQSSSTLSVNNRNKNLPLSTADFYKHVLTNSGNQFDNQLKPSEHLLNILRNRRTVGKARSNGNPMGRHPNNLQSLYNQLEIVRPCNRTIESPLLQRLLSNSFPVLSKHSEHNISTYNLLRLTTLPTHLMKLDPFLRNGEITDHPATFPIDSSSPAFALKLLCHPVPRWTPVVVFPTQSANTFLQVTVTDYPKLNACILSSCPTKCSYTVHNHLRIYARSCCPESERSRSVVEIESTVFQREDYFCREDLRQFKQIFYGVSSLAAFFSIIIIPLIIRERLQQHETRGWSLMEPFFLGAAILYLIPLLDWYGPERNSCCVAVWLRITGFTLFYGSLLLKIFRNLQEYRVRKAHHVIVREQDLLKYLIAGMLVSFLALTVWTVSSASNAELWENAWPQCPMDGTAQMWAICELIALMYAMRLCYKTRSSSWVERYQFTLAICLEAAVTLTINLIRYSIRNAGSSDALFIISIIHLHFTVSVNIAAIIAPKFLINSESSRRSLAIGSGGGSGGRAHPSLAKLRDNLVNGTIDFADIPITEMNAEDIRAELKRVYTQLRMYKLKNIYQENPHISKRKGGGKKAIEKTASKNRRISIPPQTSNNSPKVRRLEEPMISTPGMGPIGSVDDEKNDLTVESAPYNFYLSTNNKVCFLDVTNEQTSTSVRV